MQEEMLMYPNLDPDKKRLNSFAGIEGDKVQQRELRSILNMDVKLPSGKMQKISILVDTGASVNLIKEGLVNSSEFSYTSKWVQLRVANGTTMREGARLSTRS